MPKQTTDEVSTTVRPRWKAQVRPDPPEAAPNPQQATSPPATTQPDNSGKGQADEAKAIKEVRLGEPAVVVDHASKLYLADVTRGDARKNASFAEKAAHLLLRRPYKQRVWALQGVTFAARTGESVGLLGTNGAGKSTLLRLIAGVESPSQGAVYARSQPTLLGVNAALVPHISGYKNIELGCLALGLTPEEVHEYAPRIIEIADLGDAINRPMRTYSSGMRARLRFAINVAIHPDILLIDEALGTGDATFMSRSEEVLTEIRENAGTIFIVSHAPQTIERICTRGIWLHQGRIIADGPAQEIGYLYRQWTWSVSKGYLKRAERILSVRQRRYRKENVIFDQGRDYMPASHIKAGWFRR